jgi:hypothetical protein
LSKRDLNSINTYLFISVLLVSIYCISTSELDVRIVKILRKLIVEEKWMVVKN